MVLDMLTARHQLEVFQAIVFAVTVLVVNVFQAIESSSQVLLHDPTMFKLGFVRTAIRCYDPDVTTTMPRASAPDKRRNSAPLGVFSTALLCPWLWAMVSLLWHMGAL